MFGRLWWIHIQSMYILIIPTDSKLYPTSFLSFSVMLNYKSGEGESYEVLDQPSHAMGNTTKNRVEYAHN